MLVASMVQLEVDTEAGDLSKLPGTSFRLIMHTPHVDQLSKSQGS